MRHHDLPSQHALNWIGCFQVGRACELRDGGRVEAVVKGDSHTDTAIRWLRRYRYAENRLERLPELAADLVQRKVEAQNG
jgi:hypothetical protein